MNKKYSVFSLKVVKVNRGNNTFQYFICTYDYKENLYVEVFTGEKIKVIDDSFVEPLSHYYSLLEVCNYKDRRHLMLSMQRLLHKYNEINYVNYNLETDEEIIQNELEKRGIFEKSRMYQKKKK